MTNGKTNGKVFLNMAQVARLVNRAPWQVQRAVKSGQLKNHIQRRPGQKRLEAQILLEDAQRWGEAPIVARPRRPAAPKGVSERELLASIVTHIQAQTDVLRRLLRLWEPER